MPQYDLSTMSPEEVEELVAGLSTDADNIKFLRETGQDILADMVQAYRDHA